MDDFFEALGAKREKHEIINKISSIPSNYVGSKRRLLAYIWDALEQNNIEFDSVFDAFSGSSMVSLLFKHMGKKVFSNDLLTSSALTAVSLLENDTYQLSPRDIKFLCTNIPDNCGTFVLDNYKDKFFTEKECKFLDAFKHNVSELCGNKFYSGLDLTSDGKSLIDKWVCISDCKDKSMPAKFKGAFSLFAVENHVNQHCFLGGRYYNGQTVASLDHRLTHQKNNGTEIQDISLNVERCKKVLSQGDCKVFNSDIIDLLEAEVVDADLLYLDPPYGGASSDYVNLYRFLEEYLYECKLEDMEHIQKAGKRFSKGKSYQSEFENLLSLCNKFKTWMISYNESSFADLDTITSIIKNSGKTNIEVVNVPITYQYRKGKNVVESDHESYTDSGHKYLQRGTEYLILAS